MYSVHVHVHCTCTCTLYMYMYMYMYMHITASTVLVNFIPAYVFPLILSLNVIQSVMDTGTLEQKTISQVSRTLVSLSLDFSNVSGRLTDNLTPSGN